MEKRCIYCGQPITKKPAAVWLKREKEEVQCCSMDCYNKTSRFIKWDQASRLKAYVIIGICAAVNLISIGFSMEGWWTHIPVSYTHLDVYKRQERDKERLAFFRKGN